MVIGMWMAKENVVYIPNEYSSAVTKKEIMMILTI